MNGLDRCAVSLYYKNGLVVGGYVETTSWHFQLPDENNMFGKKNKLFYSCFNTVNSSFICSEAKPSKMYCIFLPAMMQLHFLCSMENVFPFYVFVFLGYLSDGTCSDVFLLNSFLSMSLTQTGNTFSLEGCH